MQTKKIKIYDQIPAYECHIELFNQYFYVLFGVDNWKALAEKNDDLKPYRDQTHSYGLVAHNETDNSIVVWFADESVIDRGTLAHECIHIANRIFETKGIQNVDEELLAYTVGYLFKHLKPLF